MKRLFILIVVLLVSGIGSAEVLPALSQRTTLHSGYDANAPIAEEDIRSILSAAFSMPTGGGQRSLEFYVVTDRETMELMRVGHPYSQALDTAPMVIVVAGNDDKAYYPELQEMDAGLAAGGMLA